MPDMDRTRNKVVTVLVAVALTVPAVWWIVTRPVHNTELDWVPPKETHVSCEHKDTIHEIVLHPDNLERFIQDLDRESAWKSKHYPYKCKVTGYVY